MLGLEHKIRSQKTSLQLDVAVKLLQKPSLIISQVIKDKLLNKINIAQLPLRSFLKADMCKEKKKKLQQHFETSYQNSDQKPKVLCEVLCVSAVIKLSHGKQRSRRSLSPVLNFLIHNFKLINFLAKWNIFHIFLFNWQFFFPFHLLVVDIYQSINNLTCILL